MEVVLFGIVGVLAVVFAWGMLVSSKPVHSALCLIGNFGCVAFLYLMLDAPFLAMVQIAVYAGAIMVLFLFVIMLLNADLTQDTTTRSFSWLWWAATGLCVVLLIVMAFPLVAFNFNLPGTPGGTPMVRVVHAANLDVVDVEIAGASLPQPWRVEDVGFGDSTGFQSLAAGDYVVNIYREDGVALALPGQEPKFTVEPGQHITLALYGTVDLTTDPITLPLVLSIPNDLQPVSSDAGRFVIFNGYSTEPVTLVDLGPDAILTTNTRDGQPFIFDPIIAENIAYNGAPVVGTYHEGVHTLAFVRPVLNAAGAVTGFEEVERLENYEITADTETTLVLVGDAVQSEASTLVGETRSTVIPGLTIDTVPTFGSPLSIGRILFTVYLLPVNLVGLLLLVALVGVIVLSRPSGDKQERRSGNLRRRVSRPLVNVISQQTGGDVVVETPKLGPGSEE